MSLNFVSRRVEPAHTSKGHRCDKEKAEVVVGCEAQTEASLGGFELFPFLKETKPQSESDMLTSLHSDAVQQKVEIRCNQTRSILMLFLFTHFCLNHPKCSC